MTEPGDRRRPDKPLPPLNTIIDDGRLKPALDSLNAYRLTPAPPEPACAPASEVVCPAGPDAPPGWVELRQRTAAAAADGCPFARFIVDAGLLDDVPDRPVRRNGKPY